VIAYAYLWRHEHQAGNDEGLKDRPSVIVLAVEREADGAMIVTVLPITHSAPTSPGAAVEIPPRSSDAWGSTISGPGSSLPRAMNFCGPGTISARSRERTATITAICRRVSSPDTQRLSGAASNRKDSDAAGLSGCLSVSPSGNQFVRKLKSTSDRSGQAPLCPPVHRLADTPVGNSHWSDWGKTMSSIFPAFFRRL
jgi:hypothetical protein